MGTDGLVVPIDVPIRDLELVLVELELDRTVAGTLLEVEMVGILLEVETVGVLLLVELLDRKFDLVAV